MRRLAHQDRVDHDQVVPRVGLEEAPHDRETLLVRTRRDEVLVVVLDLLRTHGPTQVGVPAEEDEPEQHSGAPEVGRSHRELPITSD